ncbi:glycosyltransferase, partial [Patescibacteria group bacterium]|nr:glycosyltransferase [Patescibacteria group bacterium]
SVPNIILKFHQKIWEKAKALVVITSLIKEKLLENNIKLKNIIIAPDGVDLQDFSISISKEDARKKLALPLNKMIVLYSGSFLVYKWKGVETMLAAARQCLRDDIVFVLVGGKEEEIDRLNKKFGTLSNVLLISKKSYSEIPLYLKSADILVLPNEKDEPASSLYTSPLKLFEYMASDRPIVASDLPSIRDVLNSTRCVFFLPGNPRDLVDKVLLLLGDKDLQSRISTEITHAIKRYSWDIRARNILSVCNIIN